MERAGNQAIAASLNERGLPGGQPLEPATRRSMEGPFGADLSDVRVHTGGAADATARGLSARAFTSGSDIGFRGGEYAPHGMRGRGLLAHELAHVLQQRNASSGGGGANSAAANAGLEGEARAASRATRTGAPIQVSQPSAAPAVQCEGWRDYVPDVGGAMQSLSASAFDQLGRVSGTTINGAIEWALTNPITAPVLLSHPALAAQKVAIDALVATPGALQAVWDFVKDPQSKVDKLEEAVRPHIWAGVQVGRTQGESLLRSLGVAEPHIATAGRVLEMAASVTGSAVEFVIDDVLVDTIAFYKLRSENESYDDAWKKYYAGEIDTHDIIIEHISFVLSVLGRLADLVSVVLWVSGLAGVGAAGGAVGTAVPGAGNAAGAGAGAGVGTGVGLAASEVVGIALSLGPAALEVEKMVKASGDLLLADQTDEQREQDYGQIASGAMSLAVMAALAFLPGLAVRLGKSLAKRILGMLPELSSLLPHAVRAIDAAASAMSTGRGDTHRPPASTTHAPADTPGTVAPAAASPSAAFPPASEASAAAPPVAPGTASPVASVSAPPVAPVTAPPVASGTAATTAPPAKPQPMPRDSGELPNNVRAFPAEKARPAGQDGPETSGEVIQGPFKPKPDGPEAPTPNAGAAEVPPSVADELEEVMTGTGPPMLRQKRSATPDAPVAMSGDGPKKPPEGGTPGGGVPKSRAQRWEPPKDPPRRSGDAEGPVSRESERGGAASAEDDPMPRAVGAAVTSLPTRPTALDPKLAPVFDAPSHTHPVNLRGVIDGLQRTFPNIRIVPMMRPQLEGEVNAQVAFATLADKSRVAVLQYRHPVVPAGTLGHEVNHIQDFSDGRIKPDYHFDVPGADLSFADLRALLLSAHASGPKADADWKLRSSIGELANSGRDALRWGYANEDAVGALAHQARRADDAPTTSLPPTPACASPCSVISLRAGRASTACFSKSVINSQTKSRISFSFPTSAPFSLISARRRLPVAASFRQRRAICQRPALRGRQRARSS